MLERTRRSRLSFRSNTIGGAPLSVSLGLMRALVVGILAITISAARGDMPLPPPSKVTVTSPSGRIRAISDPQLGTTVEDTAQQRVLWRMPEWHRAIFVADDGKHVVTEYDGLNLIPIDFSDDLVLLTFWREGSKIREVRVKDLFPDHSLLRRTVSHYTWGEVEGIDEHGRLRVRRIDGTTLLFDVTTGEQRKT